jgi:dolichol-phosphate mannosyltransferase
MKVAVVIAAYNEEETIGPLTQSLIRALDGLDDAAWELIYVIEGTDSTLQIVQDFARQRPEIRVLYNEQPSGLGRAFQKGFDAVPTDADFVVTMDADFNHQPEDISGLIAAMRETGADIVVGSRRMHNSTVEGMPAWKNMLSRTINRAMRHLTGAHVKDMTSGFRVYRTTALRQIQFSNVGFSFLPEILIKAAAKQLRIIERPIRFVFREAGESKMAFTATSLSYINLFVRHSIPIYVWLAIAIILAGMAVRIGFSYPAYMFPGDSDGVLAGLCAMEVLDGKLPLFFPGGFRLSSQSCYVSAGLFSLFGVNREALAATSLFYSALFLIFMWLALKQAVGGMPALAGLVLAAFAPLQVLRVTHPPWAYAEIMAICACVLWLGFRLMNKTKVHRWTEYLVFGGCIGFAFWTSPQTVMISGPILAILTFLRIFSLRKLPAVIAGAAICLYPYVLLISYRGTGPLHSFATKPVTSIEQLHSNFAYLFEYTLPVLLFTDQMRELSGITINALRALLICGIAFLAVFSVFWRPPLNPATEKRLKWNVGIGLLILIASCILYCISSAGTIRGGGTVRYIAPIFVALPLLAATCFAAARNNTGRTVIIAAIGLVVLACAIEYPFFSRFEREQRVREWQSNRAILSWLKNSNRGVVVGNYWTVYHLNFDARDAIRAIPVHGSEDYLDFRRRLQQPVRAAILDRDEAHLVKWVQMVGLKGRLEQVSDELSGFIIDDPVGDRELDLLQSAGQ